MENVDNIVLKNLTDDFIGLELDENIKTLADFKQEDVYQACLKCLQKIDATKTESFPQTLPNLTVSKELGFKGVDLSYHQFMYPTVTDLRKLLMWLIDAAPAKPGPDKPRARGEVPLDDRIEKELTSILQETWAPVFTLKGRKSYAHDVFYLSTRKITYPSRGRKIKQVPGLEKYYLKYLPYLTRQTKHREEIAPSVFETNLSVVAEQKERENEWNTKGLGTALNPMDYAKRKKENISKMMAGIIRNTMNSIEAESGEKLNKALQSAQMRGGQFQRLVQFKTEDFDAEKAEKLTEAEQQKKQEAEIEELQGRLAQLQLNKEKLDKHMKTMASSIRQIEAFINEEDGKTEKLTREYKIKKKTMDLLPNAEKNIAQLQEISASSSSRLLELAKEWETHRVPIIEQYRKLRHELLNTKDETKAKLEEIKGLRTQIKELVEEIKSKEERFRELLETHNKQQKDLKRNHYTDRILETVKSVKKQKVDIDKILIDTRNLQKEINSITDTLNRTFDVTDELVYRDAQKDPVAKDVYKQTVQLNEHFKKLTKEVEETGGNRNAILNLETKIEQVQERTNALNFERIENDLKEVKAENKLLLEKLRQ